MLLKRGVGELIRYLYLRLRKSERGASLVEFALVVPILLALVFGIIEFGWIFNGYITITGAAREGARLAAVGADIEVIEAAVENHAITFSADQGGSLVTQVPGYPDSIQPGGEIRVIVDGELPLLIGFLGGANTDSLIRFPLLDNPFPLKAEASMRREY